MIFFQIYWKNVLQIILRHRGALQLCSWYMLRLTASSYSEQNWGWEPHKVIPEMPVVPSPPWVNSNFAWNQVQDQNIIFLLGQGRITPLTNPTFMDELESKLKNKMQEKQAFVCATLNLVLAHFLSNTCENLLSVFRVWLDHTFSATTFSLLHLHLSPASGAGCAKFGTMRPSRKTLLHMQPGAFHSSSFLYHSPHH